MVCAKTFTSWLFISVFVIKRTNKIIMIKLLGLDATQSFKIVITMIMQ